MRGDSISNDQKCSLFSLSFSATDEIGHHTDMHPLFLHTQITAVLAAANSVIIKKIIAERLECKSPSWMEH